VTTDEEWTSDEFVDFDGAYVLGALSAGDRERFETHLIGCAHCRARVAELSDLPELLSLVPASAYALDAEPAPDPVISMLDALRARQRRRRWVGAAVAAVAAACLITVTAFIAHTPAKNKPAAAIASPVTMSAVTPAPIHATIEVADVAWGTSIRVHCTYDEAVSYPPDEEYSLVVRNRAGQTDDLGTWALVGGKVTTFPAGTAFHKSDIASITIDTAKGAPLLELNY
jgi:hypothetical protein